MPASWPHLPDHDHQGLLAVLDRVLLVHGTAVVAAGQLRSHQDLLDTVHTGAVERIRPIVMVSVVDILGLLPTMWATGTGADVMKRLAAPTVGGVLSGMLLTLFVIPALYAMWKWRTERKDARRDESAP